MVLVLLEIGDGGVEFVDVDIIDEVVCFVVVLGDVVVFVVGDDVFVEVVLFGNGGFVFFVDDG